MFTREQYMSGEVSHAEFYGKYVTPEIKAMVDEKLGYQLRNYQHDEHLNDIALNVWDNLAGSNMLRRMQGDYSCKRIGPDGSLASAVCTLKQAAKQIIREATLQS